MLLAALMAALLSGAQPAAPSPSAAPSDPVQTLDPLVVYGERDAAAQRSALSAFVTELSEPTRRGRLARWDQGLCPGVVGLPARYGAYIADRISQEAQAVGLLTGEPGCRPDVLILVTSEADRTARQFFDTRRAYFAERNRQEDLYSSAGDRGLERFLNEPRPVRWWHVSKLKMSDRSPMASLATEDGRDIPASAGPLASRLSARFREDFNRVLIIVDTTQLKGVSYEALASYLAMVSLAQLDPDAEPGAVASITSLFQDRAAGRTPPPGLTTWDRAYLAGLYAADRDARNLHAQRGSIRRSLLRASERR